MGICLFASGIILAVYGTYAGPEGVDNTAAASMLVTGAPSRALIALSMVFVCFFACLYGPASWTYPPELFPLHLRGKAVALCASANWAFNFALGYFVPPAFVNLRWGTYLLFGSFCAIMTVHAYLAFPETAGKTLEEVEHIFTNPNGVKYVGTPAWKTKLSRRHKGFLNGEGLEETASAQAGEEKDGKGPSTAVVLEKPHRG